MKKGKILVISAPSGTGKSTIINALLQEGQIDMQFSVSATNRAPRDGEQDGVNYHFLTTEQFQAGIASDSFVEWEEVYPGRYYGTLKSEIANKCSQGHNVVLDIDVHGALNVKKLYGPEAKTIFIMPPSIQALEQRLKNRGTETDEVIAERIARAEYEMSLAPQFDCIVVNDVLADAIDGTRAEITAFVEK